MLPEHIKLEVPEQFESLVIACCNEWAKEAGVKGHLLSGGHSGAIVLKVDIAEGQTKGKSSKGESQERVKSGYYILKLSTSSTEGYTPNEAQKHQTAIKWDESFAKAHIPDLEGEYHSKEGDALLYRIAGDSSYAYLPADYSTRDLFTPACSQLVTDLLDHWVEPELNEKFPYELLEMWLGRRLEPGAFPARQALLEKKWGENDRCSEGSIAILNPLRFYEWARDQRWEAWRYFRAGLHADLHRGNILLHVTDPSTEPYWLIDFGLARKGPAGYDQAYLEVNLIISSLQSRNPGVLVEVLNAMRASERGRKEVLPQDAEVQLLYQRLQEIRNAIISWRTRQWPNRRDDVDRQFCLARVAAGINWASKKKLNEDSRLDEASRYLALCYAGLAAQEYHDKFVSNRESMQFADHEQSIPLSAPGVEEKGADTSEPISVDEMLWQDFLRGTDNFSPQTGRFVLVAEPQQQGSEYLQALGPLPWSVIIDLDPFSDDRGLRQYTEPVLDRHIQFCSSENDVRKMEVNFAQGPRSGVAWLMANGWEMGGEKYEKDYVTWFEEKPEAIRLLIRKLLEAAGLDPIYVLVLPGGSLDSDDPAVRLADVINAIAQTARGQAKFILLGRSQKLDGRLKARHILPIPLEINACLQRIQIQFGLNKQHLEAKVPGTDGWRSIPLLDLRAMQENMTVLHSDILNEEADQEKGWPSMSFWRGNPPTWRDLEAGIDIVRPVHHDLMEDLRELLGENRNFTKRFYHRPGNGGTTAALRVAWDLHREYPTAVLTHYSLTLVHRLENLYMIAQKPVLLIADAAELREADREKLWLALSRSPARVVILYICHVLPGGNVPNPGLDQPMEDAEEFLKVYDNLTNDPDKHTELVRITYISDLERYRTPFFYGLITFDRSYVAVDRYVETHLSGVLGRQRDVLQYLALMTIYTNGGIPEALLGRLLHLSGDKKPSLSMLFQEGPAGLVTHDISGEGLRMMHPLIAEEVLERFLGIDWRNQLHKLAQAFINEVTDVVDPNLQFVRDLFRQLFVDRYGSSSDGINERPDFSPLIEEIHASCGWLAGLQTLEILTQKSSEEAHFWNHLGRYRIYRCKRYLDPRQAEVDLRHAIDLAIDIKRDEDTHRHTLGVVRREFVYEVLDDKNLSELDPSALLERIQDDFNGAVEAFGQARALNPESVYSYVSHLQMIIKVGERLKKSAGVESVTNITEYRAAEWINENMAVAWNLLEEASRLHGSFRANTLALRVLENETDERKSTYLVNCRKGLYELYGNFDEAMRHLEVNFWPPTNIKRRGLAYGYVTRAEHKRRPMTLLERQRVVDLTTELLESATPPQEGDYHLWFKAYSLQPGFDAQTALSKLAEWANHARGTSSWLASYYTYALQFSLWYFNAGISPDAMQRALGQYKGKIIGRLRYSYLWLGKNLSPCALVPDTDLGEWIRERRPRGKNFWKDTRLLRPVNGFIEHIARDTSELSTVLIKGKGKGKVEAIILSYKDSFSPYRDEKQPVHFYLGFAPNGLQAWEVEKEHVVEGAEENPETIIEKEMLLTYPEESESPSEEQQELLRLRRIEDVLVLAHDLVATRATQETPLALKELESCIEATFGVDELFQKIGYRDLEDLLRMKDSSSYVFTSVGMDRFIFSTEMPKNERQLVPQRLRGQIKVFYADEGWGRIDDWTPKQRYFKTSYVLPADREKLKKSGQEYLVQFIPDRNDLGPIATGIQLLDEMLTLTRDDLIEPGRLKPIVEAKIVEILEDAWRKHETISLRDLEKKLTEIFRGKKQLVDRLGVKHIFQFVQNMEGVVVQGSPPASDQIVRLWPAPIFDRPKQETVQELVRSGVPVEENAREARRLVIRWTQEAAQWRGELKETDIITRLSKRFQGTGKLANRFGYSLFSSFLESISEIEIYEKGSERYIRLRT